MRVPEGDIAVLVQKQGGVPATLNPDGEESSGRLELTPARQQGLRSRVEELYPWTLERVNPPLGCRSHLRLPFASLVALHETCNCSPPQANTTEQGLPVTQTLSVHPS